MVFSLTYPLWEVATITVVELQTLKLSNFRNFESFEHRFTQPVTLVLGPNGSGKSNLLEVIHFLATGSSSRTNKDAEAIRWDAKLARIAGAFDATEIAVVIQKSGKKLFVNGKQKGLKDFLPKLYVVLFQPADLNLLSGSPSNRRRFLDGLLGAYDFEYLHALSEYKKILKQRNGVLGEEVLDVNLLEVLTQQLVNGAKVLQEKRAAAIARLNSLLSPYDLSVEYKKSPRNSELEQKLSQLRKKEQAIGFTLVGPQRDDLAVTRSKIDLGIYGSRGQQRMAITRLKLAQLKIVEEEIGQKPILLLDDIFSELDHVRQEEIISILPNQQTILTSAHLEDPVIQDLQENGVDVVRLTGGTS